METPGTEPPLSRADLKGKMKVNLQDLRDTAGGTYVQECDVCDASSSSQGVSHHPPTPQGGWKGASVSGKPRTPRDASQNTPRKAPLEPHYQGLTSGVNRPVWFERGMDPPTFPMLTSDQSCDVCVVGGGIAGVTTAYLLAKKGQSVVLLEDGEIASGETGRSTAHIASGIDDRYCELVKKHGDANARLIADAHRAAIDRIERIVEKEQIDCEFERLDGYLFLAKEHMGTELLEQELEAAKKAGLHAEMADHTPFSGDHFHSGPALRFLNQAQFQPVKYTYGLAMAAKARGAKIYTHTHAQRFEEGDTNKVVTSHGHTVTSRHLVMATNVPVNDKLTMYTKVEPFRTYVIACYVPKGVVHRALYWDTADPYHYVRLADDPSCPEREVLIVGGEDHKSGQKHDHHARYNRLYEWTKGRFPEAEPPFCTWSGHIIEPVDDVGFMGRNPGSRENVYIITGDSGNGITHTTIGAMMIRDMVLGAVSPWEEVFSPSRLMTDDIMEYVKHNVSVQMRYKDWLTGGDISDIEELAPGQGAIMREGLKKYAVFKDETGNIVKCSAVCTHLAGMVAWNADEKSWDCPCHGSRFDPWGNVINGPANKPLRRK